jgi:hypothetical protein
LNVIFDVALLSLAVYAVTSIFTRQRNSKFTKPISILSTGTHK